MNEGIRVRPLNCSEMIRHLPEFSIGSGKQRSHQYQTRAIGRCCQNHRHANVAYVNLLQDDQLDGSSP